MAKSNAGRVMSKTIKARANSQNRVTTGTMGRESGNTSNFAVAKRIKPGNHSRSMGRMG